MFSPVNNIKSALNGIRLKVLIFLCTTRSHPPCDLFVFSAWRTDKNNKKRNHGERVVPNSSFAWKSKWTSVNFTYYFEYKYFTHASLQMTSNDKDFRFMATNDLMSELQKDSIKLDDESERKVVKMLLRLLEDKNGEVQNLAVKW